MKKINIKKLILETFNHIDKVSDFINGYNFNDPILKNEKTIDLLVSTEKILKEKIKDHVNFLEKTKSQFIPAVKNKAKSIGGFINVEHPHIKNKIIKFAKIPLMIWSIGNTPYQYGKEKGDILNNISNQLIKLWGETISTSNEKLKNDNVYHNEWIRSIDIEPENFYELIKGEQKWINDFSISFAKDYQNFIIKNPNNFLNFINDINEKTIKENKNCNMLNMVYKDLKEILKEEIKSIPFNINLNTNFPIYFTPVLENSIKKDKEYLIKTKCVIVENSDESINEIALTLSDFNNSIIFTRNASKTAHLINISKDLSLNIFHLSDKYLLDVNYVYKLEKNGIITKIAKNDFSNIAITLENCENELNWYDKKITPKVSNISKLKNLGFNVPNGFYKFGKTIPKFYNRFKFY